MSEVNKSEKKSVQSKIDLEDFTMLKHIATENMMSISAYIQKLVKEEVQRYKHGQYFEGQSED